MSSRTVTITVIVPEDVVAMGDTSASAYVIETVSDLLSPFGDDTEVTGASYTVTESPEL